MLQQNRNIIILGAIFVLIVVLGVVAFLMFSASDQESSEEQSQETEQSSPETTATATIQGKTIQLEVARTQEERNTGLSGRDSLPKQNGMLFLLDESTEPTAIFFYMPDMKFGIDIIWINDTEVVSITQNIPANSTEYYSPSKIVDKAIEVNAGWIKDNFNDPQSIIGQQVQFEGIESED